LALRDQRRQGLGIGRDVFDDLRLHGHRLLVGGHGGVEARARSDDLVVGQRLAEALREELVELLVEAGDVERMPWACPISRSICCSVWVSACSSGKSIVVRFFAWLIRLLRLVLQRLDLVVDLGERPGRRQDVLAVVARIEHRQLRVRRRTCHGQAHGERACRPET
jgi:hypothetical protein